MKKIRIVIVLSICLVFVALETGIYADDFDQYRPSYVKDTFLYNNVPEEYYSFAKEIEMDFINEDERDNDGSELLEFALCYLDNNNNADFLWRDKYYRTLSAYFLNGERIWNGIGGAYYVDMHVEDYYYPKTGIICYFIYDPDYLGRYEECYYKVDMDGYKFVLGRFINNDFDIERYYLDEDENQKLASEDEFNAYLKKLVGNAVRTKITTYENNEQKRNLYLKSAQTPTPIPKPVAKPTGTFITTLTEKAEGKVYIAWNKQSVTGYQIRWSLNSNMSNSRTGSYTKTNMTRSGLIGGKKYYFQVRTYKTSNGKKVYSDWSETKSIKLKKRPPKTEITGLATKSNNGFIVKWKTKTNVKGYQIRYSTDSSFKTKKTVSTTKGSISRSNLAKGKYYVSVRTYNVSSDETRYYSAWSTAKSVTVGSTATKVEVIKKENSNEEFGEAVSSLIKQYNASSTLVQAKTEPYASKRLLVQTSNTSIDFSKCGAKSIIKGPENVYILQFSSINDAKSAQKILSDNGTIETVEPDSCFEVVDDDVWKIPLSSKGTESWGTNKIKAREYSQNLQISVPGSRTITVAVVDTGVYTHPYIRDRIITTGYDYVDGDDNPNDLNGHGTHVSGTIVDCSQYLNIKILPVRVLDSDGNGWSSNVANGIRYAADRGVEVINLSLGGERNAIVDSAVQYALDKGVVVVCAAGNNRNRQGYLPDTYYYSPAHVMNAIVVAATDENDRVAPFSNYGSSVDVCAPGVDILSCDLGSGYVRKSGTSMATPHVTAMAAMYKLQNPSKKPSEVEAWIKNNTVDLGASGWDKDYGFGRIVLSNSNGGGSTTITKPAETSITLLTEEAEGKVYIAWNRQSVDGYQVRWSLNANMDNAQSASVSNAYMYKNGLVGGKTYYFQVRTYKTNNGNKVYSDWSSVRSIKLNLLPAVTTITNLIADSSSKFTVKWTKKANVKGYQIRYSTDSSFKTKKTASTTGVSMSRSGLSKGTYYVSVRTYNVASDGTKYYSAWSASKSVILKDNTPAPAVTYPTGRWVQNGDAQRVEVEFSKDSVFYYQFDYSDKAHIKPIKTWRRPIKSINKNGNVYSIVVINDDGSTYTYTTNPNDLNNMWYYSSGGMYYGGASLMKKTW